MKNLILILIVLIYFKGEAQNRENIWMLGQGNTSENPIHQGGLSFMNETVDTFSVSKFLGFIDTETGICDTAGNLQFYFNGILLNNSNNSKMQNSDSLNPGPFNGTTWPEEQGTLIFEGALVIPRPSFFNQYFLIYQNIDYVPDLGYPSLHLRYSLIDMSMNSRLGAIVKGKKQKNIVNDTLEPGGISACRHANGRDWWIIEKTVSNKFYKMLLTPDSIIINQQRIGTAFKMSTFGKWAAFSPDGKKYAYMISNFSDIDSIEVMDFDRCTGEFSNPQIWRLPNTFGVSCIFSPNNRFLYVTQLLNLYQYNVQASNISQSLIKIDTFDGTIDTTAGGIPAWFAEDELAPDGKVYIGTWGSFKSLHVINDPDSLGKACDFKQHSFPLSFYNFCTPYYPNYDLGALIGSDCDSLTSVYNPLENWNFKVYPNPVSQRLNIEYESHENLRCQLFDITGRVIANFILYPYFKSRMYDMSKLPAGIYILSSKDEKGKSVERKIVKE